MKCLINSHDEWTQLHEIIVGNVDNFPGFHLDSSFSLFYWDNLKTFLQKNNFFKNNIAGYRWPVINIEQYIIEELKEDIEELVSNLIKLGISVKRPEKMNSNIEISTPFWNSIQTPPLNIRDQTIILGNTIVETATHVRSRLFENDYLKPLFYEYYKSGANWLQMPRPILSRNSIDKSFFKLNGVERAFLAENEIKKLDLKNKEMIFDGAQCIRLGKDILINVANKNHELGFSWLKTNFSSEYTFHKLDKMTDSHIDSIILPLREGLWLIRDKSYLKFLPQKFSKWDFIVAPEVMKDNFPSYQKNRLSISSKFIDMNILSINETTVIVNSLYPELISTLEKESFNVVPVRHRHRRLFGGGFHCFTLDVKREGQLVSYAK